MQTVTIVAGANSSALNVTLTNDDIVEQDQMFNITLFVPSSPGSRITAGTIRSATGIINDTNSELHYCYYVILPCMVILLHVAM